MGLWNRRIKCVYITHLPVIPLPEKLVYLEWIGILFHRYFIRKYSFCFIPDLPGKTNLTGRLTHNLKLPVNTRFIGILSRFGTSEPSAKSKSGFVHNTIILSGPEPQRSILRQRLVSILDDAEPTTVILEGKPGRYNGPVRTGNIISYNHLPPDKMQNMISGSEVVITRSGYTTIMELISLNCSALLIPTPGQPEQEYLAKYLSGKGWFTTMTQKSIKEGITLSAGKTTWPSGMIYESRELLDKALDELLNQ
jgi:UDP-N-acetylglucosamine transferase subunit ALG13